MSLKVPEMGMKEKMEATEVDLDAVIDEEISADDGVRYIGDEEHPMLTGSKGALTINVDG